MSIEIRPASAADLLAFYGKPPTRTSRAFCIFKDGEIGAIAGITLNPPLVTFFSDIKEDIDVPKMTVWRVSKEIVHRVREMKLPVYAVENCQKETAERFLQALGFVFIGTFDGNKNYRLE